MRRGSHVSHTKPARWISETCTRAASMSQQPDHRPVRKHMKRKNHGMQMSCTHRVCDVHISPTLSLAFCSRTSVVSCGAMLFFQKTVCRPIAPPDQSCCLREPYKTGDHHSICSEHSSAENCHVSVQHTKERYPASVFCPFCQSLLWKNVN